MFALALKRARARTPFSQSDLARKAGVSPSTISKAESGVLELSLGTLVKVSEVLGVEAERELLLAAGYIRGDAAVESRRREIEVLRREGRIMLQKADRLERLLARDLNMTTA